MQIPCKPIFNVTYIHGKAFAVLLKTVKNAKVNPANLSLFTVAKP